MRRTHMRIALGILALFFAGLAMFVVGVNVGAHFWPSEQQIGERP